MFAVLTRLGAFDLLLRLTLCMMLSLVLLRKESYQVFWGTIPTSRSKTRFWASESRETVIWTYSSVSTMIERRCFFPHILHVLFLTCLARFIPAPGIPSIHWGSAYAFLFSMNLSKRDSLTSTCLFHSFEYFSWALRILSWEVSFKTMRIGMLRLLVPFETGSGAVVGGSHSLVSSD